MSFCPYFSLDLHGVTIRLIVYTIISEHIFGIYVVFSKHFVSLHKEIIITSINNTMARPIKETPILFGEDARRFKERMKEHRRISSKERAEMKSIYEAVMSVADFR